MEDDSSSKTVAASRFAASSESASELSYSKLIEKFPLEESMTLDDILHISHKTADGSWQTCYITVKQLKEAIVNL